MNKRERIGVLRKFHIKLRVAEHLRDGFRINLYKGAVRSTEQLLESENKLTKEEVKALRDSFDQEIEKAGIDASQFSALYRST